LAFNPRPVAARAEGFQEAYQFLARFLTFSADFAEGRLASLNG
jgi:hypothetical protein